MNPVNFMIYLWVTAITPGPNTITSMTYGNRHGMRKALPFNLGVFAGMLSLALLAGFLGNALLTVLPGVQGILKWVGIAYLLWLAWHIFRTGPLEGENTATEASFPKGLLLQFINVKGILYSITSMTTFVLPYVHSPGAIILYALLLAVVALIASLIWSAFGSLFRNLFQTHYKLVNTILALLLVYCAWSLYH